LSNIKESNMNRTQRFKPAKNAFFTILILVTACSALADVRLPHIISDNMVLQRDNELPIWGCADPGEKITLEFAGSKMSVVADDNGSWQTKLPPTKAGGPFVMSISGHNFIQIKNILIGDVWLCSGQSNMEWLLNKTTNAAKDIAEANYPQIRILTVPKKTAGLPRTDADVEWKICKPETIYNFSAVAYFFGRKIHKELNVPIGLINSSWGGSRIEPWTPPEGFDLSEKTKDIATYIQQVNSDYRKTIEKSLDNMQDWLAKTKKAVADNTPLPPELDLPKHQLNNFSQPTGIYNSMIYPFRPFAICGAIWYQGEANVSDGMLYLEKMKALIEGLRKVWGQGNFPFYFVQLAPYRYKDNPYRLPVIWQAQTAALSAIPNTGMAVTIDLVDDINDIHPRNKKDVGERLALWALAKTYGRNIPVYSGPIYKSMKIEDSNTIRIFFDYTGSGLISRDNTPLTNFEIAGADKNFVKADAVIDNNTVLVRSENVDKPTAVRFAWNEDAQPNLCNKAGLPASSFTTDQ
jgi:sialate O-acetylesterase